MKNFPRNNEPATKAQSQPDEPVGDQDPKIFFLKRELSEVHLLLDNLSANPDLSLTTELDKNEKLADNWIEQVCRLNWAPSGTPADQAKHAALLIRAKDFLNRQAKPASGGTIAFTLLVAQGNADGGEVAKIPTRLPHEIPSHARPTQAWSIGRGHSGA